MKNQTIRTRITGFDIINTTLTKVGGIVMISVAGDNKGFIGGSSIPESCFNASVLKNTVINLIKRG